MPAEMDVKWPARRSKREQGNDPTRDRTARHSESGGARSGRGLFDRGHSRHECADTERVRNKTPFFT